MKSAKALKTFSVEIRSVKKMRVGINSHKIAEKKACCLSANCIPIRKTKTTDREENTIPVSCAIRTDEPNKRNMIDKIEGKIIMCGNDAT